MDEEATLTGAENDDQDADLLAALNGDVDDSPGDDGQDDDQPKPDLYAVKINGVEKQVTRDDLIAHYQKGEAANAKFEEAAALRREAEQHTTQHQAQLQQAINHFNGLAQQWAKEQQPDWQDLLDNNPHEYLRQQKIHSERAAQYQQAQAAQAHLDEQARTKQNQNISEHIAKESAKLTEVIPEWKDAKSREREETELVSYLTNQGYTPEELQNLNYSKASNIALVVKAMRYDALVNKARAVGKPVDVTQIKPVPTLGGASAVSRKSPDKMTDKEFASWRKSQIAKRN